MITTSLALALLTGTGFYLLYSKLPRRIRKFMQRHVLLTDTVACLLTYVLFGGTLIALFAAAWLGVIVSILLAITSNPVTNDALEKMVQKIGSLKDSLVNWIAERAQKEEGEKPKLEVVK